jgi:transcription-repair coupling factor (superfamily II helicase)
LQQDVVFKDLGLLVVDEEQRFGVRHKEAIKRLKENIDVLTLTATPIPRTLHMSMAGIRDMSVILDPPRDRFPLRPLSLNKATGLSGTPYKGNWAGTVRFTLYTTVFIP